MHLSKLRKTQHGVSMLEVLIALLIITIGALGFAGLQMKALHSSNDANHRARAILLAQDAVERFQANPTELDNYLSASWPNTGSLSTSCSGEEPCAADAIRDQDLGELAHNAESSLPGGQIMAEECPFNDMACIVISWGEQDIDACLGAGGIDNEQNQCLVMEFAR